MTKHTETPWKPFGRFGDAIETADGVIFYFEATGINALAKQKELTARTIQCVNACEGIADPSVVPELVEAVKALVGGLDENCGITCHAYACGCKEWAEPKLHALLSRIKGEA